MHRQSDDYDDDDDEKSDRSDDSKIADMLSNSHSLSLHRMGSHVAAFFHAWRPSLPQTEAA